MNTSPAFLTYGAFNEWLAEQPRHLTFSDITNWLPDDFLDNMTGKGTPSVQGSIMGAKVQMKLSNLVKFKQSKPSQISPKEYKTFLFHIEHAKFTLTLNFKAKAGDMRPWLCSGTGCTYDFTGTDSDFLNWLSQVKLQGQEMFSKVNQGMLAGAAVYASKNP
ncbi:hypothetical protein [Methylobacterium sp. Leaf89]|uniref:hypothetical protein n=1 Tax=Methylobacterium sp. Leaf89 TaxID=1736245 RepID=UPI0006F25F70|nr:hypothetical protein [Methylobacterium sp. Leaf89]KQO67242.1 hypothetical protein ASF18_11260 [Methylobacterium sp. Leaf89]